MGISAMAALLKEEPPETVITAREVIIRYEIVPGIELNVSREAEIREPKKILEIIRVAKAIAQGKVKNE